jgi:hypothetical protein
VAATEKEAVCPELTVWLAGVVVIEGAIGVELLLLEATPAQPEFANPASTVTKTSAQRFIMRLFHKVFSGNQPSCIGQEEISRKAELRANLTGLEAG